MMHTLEIGRRPIAIMNATFDEAEKWFTSSAFTQELSARRDNCGDPLWRDGSAFLVRPAFEDEIDRWNAARAAGDADEEDKAGYFTFLVPVTHADGLESAVAETEPLHAAAV